MKAKAFRSRRTAFVSAIMLSSCAMPAFAQDTPAEEVDEDAEILVTGYLGESDAAIQTAAGFRRVRDVGTCTGVGRVHEHGEFDGARNEFTNQLDLFATEQ